jgi:DNA-binding MarR family transcriptional regulator
MLVRKYMSGVHRTCEGVVMAADAVIGGPAGGAAEAFIRASRALVGMAIRSIGAAPVEVTLPQHRLLVLLANGGPQTVGQLAEQLGVDQSNASRLGDRLQRLGLVVRQRSASDGRAVEITLASPGHELLAAVDAARRREVERVLAAMSPEDVAAAVRALEAFSTAAHETGGQSRALHGL